MSSFLCEYKSSLFSIELGTPLDKLLDVFGTFGHQSFDSGRIAQSSTSDQGIFFVKTCLIVFRQDDGHSALRILCIGFTCFVFCEHGDRSSMFRKGDRRAQSRDAAANDNKIAL